MQRSIAETAGNLRGTIAFPVTPLLDDAECSIDWESFERHVDFIAGSGVAALVIAGGTGEFFSLHPNEVAELARRGVEAAAERALVFVGAGGAGAVGAALARAACDAGADGVLMMPPYYPTPDLHALTDYYRCISDAAPEIATIVYARASVRLTPMVLHELASIENLIAVKDGQGDVRAFIRNRQALGDRYIWLSGAGDDLVGAYAAAGAEGYTSSIACFDPALSLELWRLASTGRHADLRRLASERVAPWYELRTRALGYEVAVMKGAMEAYGQRAGGVRPPLANLSAGDRQAVHETAARIGLYGVYDTLR